MDNTTTNEMQALLARWAELEPERCRNIEEVGAFGIKFGDSRFWGLIRLDDLSEGVSLVQVQAAVQEAIVSRGWPFELTYYSILGHYDAEIDIDSHRSFCREGSNSAEALLSVYVKALEEK